MTFSEKFVFHRVTEVKDGNIRRAYRLETYRKILFTVIMILISVFVFIYTTGVGNYNCSFVDALNVIVNKILGNPITHDQEHYIWGMYVPRAISGVCVGVGLAIAGCVMQNILRNPLAEPYTMGISSGAMFGATVSIAFGIHLFPFLSGYYATAANALVFSLVPLAIILVIATFKKVTPVMMILTGIAVMYLFSSVNSIVMATSSSDTLQDIYMWNIGSLLRTTGDEAWAMVPLMVGSVIVFSAALLFLNSKLDVMYAGDRSAQSLGLRVHLFRILVLVLASMMTAILVSATGTIGFVGLVAPHVARIFVGSNNRFLMPASAAFGVAFLLCADTIAKLIGNGSLPVGVISSLVGGPLFLYILIKQRKHAWM